MKEREREIEKERGKIGELMYIYSVYSLIQEVPLVPPSRELQKLGTGWGGLVMMSRRILTLNFYFTKVISKAGAADGSHLEVLLLSCTH